MSERSPYGLAACLGGDLRRFRELTSGVPLTAPLSVRDRLRLLSPRMMPNLLIRLAYWTDCLGLGTIARLIALLAFIIFGIEFAIKCPIGPGLFLPHTQGTVLGAGAIGRNATIYHQVTLGARELDLGYDITSRPTIGDNVLIGAGAKILGAVKIGNGVKIAANATVVQSLPEGIVALGPVAKLVVSDL